MLKAALLPLTCPEPADDETGDVVPDPRDGGARMWDALVMTAHHALDTDLPPTTHGARPRIAITIDYATLTDSASTRRWSSLSRPRTDDGLELPAGVVRRLACDAEIIPVVLGTQSEILDVGRTHRLVTPAHLAGPRGQGRALHLPRLPTTTPHVPRPPHHTLARPRRNETRQPRPPLRPPPPDHSQHTLGNTTQPRRQATGIQAATKSGKDIQIRARPTETRIVSGQVRGYRGPSIPCPV